MYINLLILFPEGYYNNFLIKIELKIALDLLKCLLIYPIYISYNILRAIFSTKNWNVVLEF